MEDGGGEEVNPFSFKSFVQGKSVDPPPYPINIERKEKQVNRPKNSSKVRKSFHEDEVPFPDVDKLVETHPDPNSTKSSQEYLSCEDISSNGGAASRDGETNPFSFKNFVSKEKDVASKKKRVLQIIGDEVHEVKPLPSHNVHDKDDNSQYVFGFTPPGSDTSDSETDDRHSSHSLNCHSPDSGSVHYLVAAADSSQDQLMLIEELNQLREDNKRLKKEIDDMTTSRDNERKRVFTLQKKLAMIEKREAEETAALENMVQMVEQNLSLTTKRALKAEAQVAKMKEEVKGAKCDTVPMETYQQLLDTHHSTLTSIKAKSRAASDEMILAAGRAEQALRDLYSGVDTLRLVSSELHYIDRITDVTPASKPDS